MMLGCMKEVALGCMKLPETYLLLYFGVSALVGEKYLGTETRKQLVHRMIHFLSCLPL